MNTTLTAEHIRDAKQHAHRYIDIPLFEAYPELLQGFTTRFGGVSTGEFESLNLNFNRPDPRSNVLENFRLLADDLGVSRDQMVYSFQIHSNKVIPVDGEHRGMGIMRERSFRDVDGLMTQTPGLMLVTCYADCVPLYFYDPIRKAIALSHSGWKGTLLDIAGETLKGLNATYGCQPSDLIVGFGPHIGLCCFEVDEDVAGQFLARFEWARDNAFKKPDGKWMINLEGIITQSLIRQGVNPSKIAGCQVCTRCEKEVFFSHRGMHGKTGTGAAFMMIRG
ncbi:MAG: peptidoglycan editing factor PgeF [Clostridia bacterium]|nr:peptidoglycan editing factor PgeF [Clostridia bacterium]